MDEKKKKHIENASKVWELHLEEHTQASIAKQLKLNKTEVNYILKFTTAYMYYNTDKVREVYVSLLYAEALNREAEQEITLLKKQIAYAKLPWWKKLWNKIGG